MFGESILLYNLISQAVTALAGDYKDAVIREENEEWGVFDCKNLMKTATPTPVSKNRLSTLELTFEASDPLGILLGSTVYLTPEEMEYLTEVGESNDWGRQEVADVLLFIKQEQPMRRLFRSCT